MIDILLVILVHLRVWVSGLSETWWVRMYNQIGMWSWHVSHTHIHRLTAPIFILQTCFTHFHTHPCPPPGVVELPETPQILLESSE